MPGAPNRPPEIDAPTPPVAIAPERRVFRRLAASRVALNLEMWKGAPSPELVDPLTRAEAAYTSGDLVNAEQALDHLSVRFAEPRWPTMPAPFRDLRVAIPAPMPPQWDADFAVDAAEKERRKVRRSAELQLALAKATAAYAAKRGIPADDLASEATEADAEFARAGASEAFWTHIDTLWTAARTRFPLPARGPGRAAPVAPPADDATA
ncbi:MAG TPA: hypothetical protein VGP88_04935 [Thermoplasmata archaeon]|jgi:hypothetical protein|nr:hypothetical protein [Thermoplasmata archaeon]